MDNIKQGERSENYCSAYKGNTTLIISISHRIPFLVAFRFLTLHK